ncbi:chromate transporter [Alicyclobacillus cellulosilyticus]|uniref:Chromate transporter n=1 Tax=Alicyclobacillus cellulosilyticus TaxID=1003997 RepID=A0A917K3T9_9BACL|nr:chromate efflux transporter [Alicyclobacillus cellulosilyticus]GGI99789.1 chromate transporter [Alicyclobacillus cellulosilyticus]
MRQETNSGSATGGNASRGSVGEVFQVALRLGLTSFGGPIAHLGYFHDEYVQRRRWLDEQDYADLVALCQFLPGPASSQVGIAIGIRRAGLLGGLAAWAGFTLPSAVALVVFAYILTGTHVQHPGWLHGMMLVAVAVVAQAVWSMATRFATGKAPGTIALVSAVLSLLWPSSVVQVAIIAAAGMVGWRWLAPSSATVAGDAGMFSVPIRRRTAAGSLACFFALLLALPVLRAITHNQTLAVIDSFYRAGALVFGGGHVVLPLLENQVVPPGWVTKDQFLAGYGAAQAVPGPLFTFAAYLGAVMRPYPHGVLGAAVALVAIFLPAFLLVVGVLPFWDALRRRPGCHAALAGVNAAVVGVLAAALYNPVFTTAVRTPADLCVAIVAYGWIAMWRLPVWGAVILSAFAGMMLSWI